MAERATKFEIVDIEAEYNEDGEIEAYHTVIVERPDYRGLCPHEVQTKIRHN